MARYAEAMAGVVRNYGGTSSGSGGTVMAVFGNPPVPEDDALRAVRAAAEMQRRLALLTLSCRALGCRARVPDRITPGRSSGRSRNSEETFVTGDAVNLAKGSSSRRAGAILIGTAT